MVNGGGVVMAMVVVGWGLATTVVAVLALTSAPTIELVVVEVVAMVVVA